MVVLIAGCSHAGKTLFAQKLLERYGYPYLSLDHLKMGLIRSGNISLTPEDDEELEKRLWPIAREIVKTAVENRQNLSVEGCYIPLDWKKDFGGEYLKHIRYRCLIMTENYINSRFELIKKHACAIEKRLGGSSVSKRDLIAENTRNLAGCEKNGYDYILIDKDWERDCLPEIQYL